MKNIPYALVVRSLMYDLMCTKSNIAFIIGMLGRYQRNTSVDHQKLQRK